MIAARKSVTDFIEDSRAQRADTDALYFGRAAHVHTLEGVAAFHREYIVGGPTNPRTGKTYGTRSKAYQAWARTQPKPAVTPEELALIERMTRSVHGKRAAQQLLSDGKAELTGRTEILGVPCQIRLDWLTGDDRIVDYKTCADLSTITVDVEQYGYVIQQAFYRQCLERIIGKRCPVYLVWCEKTEQPNSVVWKLDDDRLDHEASENERVIGELEEVFHQLAKEKRPCQSGPSSKTSTKTQSIQGHPRATPSIA